MAALFRTSELVAVAEGNAELAPLSALVLARVATERGATRADVLRDVGRLTSHKFSPGEWRSTAEKELLELEDADLVEKKRTRYTATPYGDQAINRFLYKKTDAKALTWAEQRDTFLIARSLGLAGISAANLKSLKRPEGLRALIVQNAFNLPLDGNQSSQDLRTALAVIALGRAFGNSIKTDLNTTKNFSATAGRALAGQLCRRPREFSADGKLISILAAEAVDARQIDFESLQLEVLRQLTSPREENKCGDEKAAEIKENLDTGRTKNTQPSAQTKGECAQKRRPDLSRFANCVHEAARQHAEGWPGNQKAFISHVWQSIRERHAEWGISEIEFKCMLAEAHRSGQVALANADLKDKSKIAEIEASAITYKNTVWHLIRVAEGA